MDCRYSGGLPKNFLQPCLLLLLKEEPGYGYDLVTRLKELGIDDDSASVYRALRGLEEKSAVSSYWHTSSTGPARRMYRLTPAGEEMLEASVEAFADTHRAIEKYLCRHTLALSRARTEASDGKSESPLPKRPDSIVAALRRTTR
jgi:PadR family transcriptional regulator, regulatory protein PadR